MAEYTSREEKRRAQQASKKKGNSKKKPKKSLWKRLILVVFLLGLAGLLGGGGLFAYYVFQAPELNEDDFIDPVATEFYDMDQNLIGKIGAENRELVNYEDIPPMVENAVLATEDVRFYEHKGVDVIRLGGAVLANITRGFGAEGASTLTQQVIKQSVLSDEKSLERKAQEAWLAFQLEQEYSKEDILEMYLNKIYYSDGIYGIKTAADYYYGVELNELELHQAALLAGMPQRPNAYNPYEDPDLAKERRDIVLRLMNQHGKITEQEMQDAQAKDIMDGIVEREEERNTFATIEGYEAFIDVVIDEVEELGDYNVYEDGLKIYTTLDPDAQTEVENVLDGDIINFPTDMEDADGEVERSQAGVTLLDTSTGAIRAIGGGRDYGLRDFNHAVDIKRSPGSTIKPLLDYAPAIEELKWSTAHIVIDEPFAYESAPDVRPNNFDGRFLGPITIRQALANSRNITAIKAYNEAGHENATEFIHGLGLHFKDDCSEGSGGLCESASIGAINDGTNTLEMAGAYAAFGNNGIYNEPYAISAIELRDGSTIDTVPDSNVAMSDSTAYMITDMLKDVIEDPSYGTGRDARISGTPVAGKSGTTNYPQEFRQENNIPSDGAPDSWFSGYTTQYTATVWLGYPRTYSNYLSPSERVVSQEIFREVMERVSAEIDTPDFERPGSVVEVEVEIGTNPPKLASAYTPDSRKRIELFIKGTEPTEISEEFVAPDLNAPSDLKADYNEESSSLTLSWDHEQEENDNRSVQFEVSYSTNGRPSQALSTIDQNGLNIELVEPGSSYVFSVVAIADGERSDPATLNVQIDQREEEPEEDVDPVEEETPPPDEESESDNGNGRGNGRGNGQPEDDDNGNSPDDQSPPDGTGVDDESTNPENPEEPTDPEDADGTSEEIPDGA
ncbi:penicillin-binding protein 1A [Jeotgalibacillus soli]|uniref:Penicillin-binding protein n=1 Tax=Jeotgalibacillus soli TaxID=889306 RepID=A0A0C2VI30_9BACL|nr:penicillin-binding protein 1A [Jeotgalibacillus soli]KIL44166.1 penicillin-binding protein [Jeotgalibacillus soli]